MKKDYEKEKVLNVLKKFYYSRKGAVHFSSPFKVLISCILSQRTKEENTEKASLKLFSVADTPEKLAKLSLREIESLIKQVGFYKQKARRIKQIAKIILEKYNGKIPKNREELMRLPGVGFKTSAVTLSYGHGIPIIAVDTHVNRISKRLGLVKENANVEEVRKTLEKIFPKSQWKYVNLGFVNFGREVCKPINPKCNECELKNICKFYKNKKHEKVFKTKKSRRSEKTQ